MTLYVSIDWEQCKAYHFATQAEAMKVYNTHSGWEILFEGDKIAQIYKSGAAQSEGFMAFCMEDAHM